jgi:hypothetical protein
MNHFSCPHFGNNCAALLQSIVPRIRIYRRRFGCSHPRLAGPDLMQPAIRRQESDFPKQAHPYPSLCKFLPPVTWVLVTSLYTKLSNCEITCLPLLFPLGSGLIRAFIHCERSCRSQVVRRVQPAFWPTLFVFGRESSQRELLGIA